MLFWTLYFTLITAIILPVTQAHGKLTPDYYNDVCPQALPTIRVMVETVVGIQPRMGASLVRLHFHDCFAKGCDGSVLLDDSPTMVGEKTAAPNNNSLRGFELVDEIKATLNVACFGNVVSCADILAIAARDSVVARTFDEHLGRLHLQLGGSSYEVLLGRQDSTCASKAEANSNIPSPFSNLTDMLSKFQAHNLSAEDLVLLSGAHTLGFAKCKTLRNRIYNETSTIDPDFARSLKAKCHRPAGGSDDEELSPLDETPAAFDAGYYQMLTQRKGMLHTDQELFKGDGSEIDRLVKRYAEDAGAFKEGFGAAMVRLGSIKPLTGREGEVRENCRVVNRR
ncbi:hypothetical protein ZIOFF_052158 [Zingiber officinale]|uniref:Peroxidase n=1 Tax=Zingiber officinale TaxID=94328 RepID=A0A8J5FN26_ZINOF|nr:hypothetical protein ZIOFF_052158 [Zingiber officinale]